MRITFVLPTVGMSGGIKVVAIYAQLLAARGHQVTLVSPPPVPSGLRRRIKSLLMGNGWPENPSRPASHLDGSGLVHRVLEKWRPVSDGDVPEADVVIATWWETAEWVNALSPNKGAKVYFIQHHEVFSYLPVARCHATYRLPMHKIVIARWLEKVMRTEYGDPLVDLVPNSVDQTQFFAASRGKQPVPTIGFLYASTAFKGLDVTLAALAAISERFPDRRLVSFGSEQPNATLRLPVGTDFIFQPPQNEIRNLYAQCDVWVTASRSEGFNLPAMEAMACRTPVVSTRTGWPEEAIETGKNGVLVDVDDVDALASGLSQILLLDDAQWKAMSSRAHATVASSSWDLSAQKFEAALVNACRRARLGEIGGSPSDFA